MVKKLYTEASVQDIADAIREKNGTNNTYKTSEMAAAIEALSGGRTVVNGVIEQYKAATTTISADTFVQFVDSYETAQQQDMGVAQNHTSSGIYKIQAAKALKLNDTRLLLVVTGGTSSNPYISPILPGNAYGTYAFVCTVSSSQIVVDVGQKLSHTYSGQDDLCLTKPLHPSWASAPYKVLISSGDTAQILLITNASIPQITQGATVNIFSDIYSDGGRTSTVISAASATDCYVWACGGANDDDSDNGIVFARVGLVSGADSTTIVWQGYTTIEEISGSNDFGTLPTALLQSDVEGAVFPNAVVAFFAAESSEHNGETVMATMLVYYQGTFVRLNEQDLWPMTDSSSGSNYHYITNIAAEIYSEADEAFFLTFKEYYMGNITHYGQILRGFDDPTSSVFAELNDCESLWGAIHPSTELYSTVCHIPNTNKYVGYVHNLTLGEGSSAGWLRVYGHFDTHDNSYTPIVDGYTTASSDNMLFNSTFESSAAVTTAAVFGDKIAVLRDRILTTENWTTPYGVTTLYLEVLDRRVEETDPEEETPIIDGLTKTDCTVATAGDVWVLNTNESD